MATMNGTTLKQSEALRIAIEAIIDRAGTVGMTEGYFGALCVLFDNYSTAIYGENLGKGGETNGV